MAETLSVRNFGPVREADIEVRDLTVFVGPQATGKSITAQLLYFLRGLEGLVDRSIETYQRQQQRFLHTKEAPITYADDSALQSVVSALEWWFGNDIAVYTETDTVVSWNPEAPSLETNSEIYWKDTGPELSSALAHRMAVAQSSLYTFFHPQVYVPAGRTLYSLLSPVSALYFLSRRGAEAEWPGYIASFYEALGSIIRRRWREQEERQQSFFQDIPHTDFVRTRLDRIMKGEILYGPDTILLRVGDQVLRPETIAAGQMEVWPFWVLLEETLVSGHPNRTRIYFEEPEAHLHPGAQRDLLEIVAHYVRQGNQFLITTHSPYILYAINNALMAQQVLNEGKRLPSDIPQEIALRADQVAAYRFSADGHVYDIMDAEVGLIDEDELDQVADDLGSDFTSLQDRLEDAV